MKNNASFPIKLGSTGKAVAMVQVAAGVPITGTWDAKTNLAVRAKFGITEIGAQLFLKSCADISPVEQTTYFPITNTGFDSQMNGKYVKDVQILIGVAPTGFYGLDTQAAVKKALGTDSISHQDYIDLVGKVLGIKTNHITGGSIAGSL